jgi:hypothetical protein
MTDRYRTPSRSGEALDSSRLTQAERLWRRAPEIRERTLGPQQPDVAVTLARDASLLRTMHRDAEAAVLRARAEQIDAKSGAAEPANPGPRVPKRKRGVMTDRSWWHLCPSAGAVLARERPDRKPQRVMRPLISGVGNARSSRAPTAKRGRSRHDRSLGLNGAPDGCDAKVRRLPEAALRALGGGRAR